MTYSLIFPCLILNIVNLLFYKSFYWKCLEFPRFCNIARRSKVVGPRCCKLLFQSFCIVRSVLNRYWSFTTKL